MLHQKITGPMEYVHTQVKHAVTKKRTTKMVQHFSSKLGVSSDFCRGK